MNLNVENIGTPENSAQFPVDQLDERLVSAIGTIEAELSLMPKDPDQKHDSLYAFGTPEAKMRADNDDANPILMAAVDATLGNVMSAGMGLSPQAAQAVGSLSNVAEGMSTFAKGNNKPAFKRKGKGKNNTVKKPSPSQTMQPKSTSRGGKVVSKSAKQKMQEQKKEAQRAAFKKTAGKRMAMEKRANELYQMREILNKYKRQGIKKVEVDMDGNKIAPLAGGAVFLHRPKFAAPAMRAPAPTPFAL